MAQDFTFTALTGAVNIQNVASGENFDITIPVNTATMEISINDTAANNTITLEWRMGKAITFTQSEVSDPTGLSDIYDLRDALAALLYQ